MIGSILSGVFRCCQVQYTDLEAVVSGHNWFSFSV